MEPGINISFYQLVERIGKGGFGSVWKVKSTEDDKFYAMKLEPISSKKSTLKFEASILKKMQTSDHFPQFLLDGADSGYNYLVEELLGPNLQQICNSFPFNHFERPFLIGLADQMLSCIEAFHSKGYVHRDIKPQNFVVRLDGDAPICLVDYGIARQYIDFNTNTHISARDYSQTIGSPIYASPHTHEHLELSRRDDLYSWLYSILILSDIKLPWTAEPNIIEIGRSKSQNPVSSLFSSFDEGFIKIAKHIELLGFADTPDYAMMHQELKKMQIPLNVPFQWMGTKIPKMALQEEAPIFRLYDPTGYLTYIAPYCKPPDNGCYLI